MNGERLVQNIKALTVQKGLKMKELLALCGITSGALSQWKSGLTKPHTATLYKIATVLGVTIQDLLEGTEKEIPASPEASGEDAEFLNLYHRATPMMQNLVVKMLREAELFDATQGDDSKE